MKSELGPTPDLPPESKNGAETTSARARKGKRRSLQTVSSERAIVRFFLSKSENNSVPMVDREFTSEAEAMIESLKTGKSYFVVSEWIGLADYSKKMPLIRKELVTGKKHNPE